MIESPSGGNPNPFLMSKSKLMMNCGEAQLAFDQDYVGLLLVGSKPYQTLKG
jgi:hypothetical protein